MIKKNNKINYFFIILLFFLIFFQKAEAYPSFTGNVDLVSSAEYGFSPTAGGALNWGTGSFTTREFLSGGQTARIRQGGQVEKFRFWIGNVDIINDLYIKIWRYDGANYDLVWTSEDFRPQVTVSSTFYTLTPASLPTVQEGDFIGYKVVMNTAGNWTYALSQANAAVTIGFTTYIVNAGGVADDANYNWPGQAAVARSFWPIEVQMTAPKLVVVGDSIAMGAPDHTSYLSSTFESVPASSIPYKLGVLLGGITYQNMGAGSQTTAQISARFATDVVALMPKLVVVEGGVNDINTAVAADTIIANWTSMLNSCVSNNLTCVALGVLPWTDGSNAEMQTRDSVNAQLSALISASYPDNVIYVDTDTYVGSNRVGGDANNLWNMGAAYNSGDNVHYNADGYQQISQAILEALTPRFTWGSFNSWNGTSISNSYTIRAPGDGTLISVANANTSGIEYSTDNLAWQDATAGVGGDGYTGLSGTMAGVAHTFVWDTATDLAGVEDESVYLRIRGGDNISTSTAWTTSTAFAVDLVAPSAIGVPTFSTITTDSITVVKPVAVTENSSGLNQWRAKRDVTVLNLTSTTTASVVDSGLTPNTQYTYSVLYSDAVGNVSDYGDTAAKYTLTNAPTAATVNGAATTTLNVAINANGNSAVTTFSIYNLDAGSYVAANGSASVTAVFRTAAAWGTVTATGLSTSTPYCFTSLAKNGDGVESATSTATCAYTLAEIPSAPTVSTPALSTLALTIPDGNNTTSTEYSIYNTTSGNYIAATGAATASPVFQTNAVWSTVTLTGLSVNTAYQFSVVPKNASGTQSTTSSASTALYTLSAVPTGLTVTADNTTQITTAWTANGNPGTTEYYIVDSSDSTRNSGWTTALTYAFSGLHPDTSYSFSVNARNGNSVETAYTSIASAQTISDEGGSGAGGNGSPIQLSPIISVQVNATPTDDTVEAGQEERAPITSTFVRAAFSEGSHVSMSIGNEVHTITLDNVINGRAYLTVRSEPQLLNLATGEEMTIDVNADSVADLHIAAVRLSEDTNQADFAVTNLAEMYASINDNYSKTYSRDISVRIRAVNDVTLMALSEDPSFAGVSFVPYQSLVHYTLSQGNGFKTLYVRLKTESGATATVSDTIEVVSGGCPLAIQKAYKHPLSPAVYFITPECTKRAFKRADTFFTYFSSWKDVLSVEKSIINNITDDALGFMPQGPLYDPQYGALVKIVSDPKVYLLLGNNKQWIKSENVFNALLYKWDWIEDVDSRLLDKYQSQGEITDTAHHPNYTLLKYENSPSVYRLEPNKNNITLKRHIANESVFFSLKYRWDRIVTIPLSEQYPEGAELTGLGS